MALADLQRLSESRRHTDCAVCDQMGHECIEQSVAPTDALFALLREINIDRNPIMDRYANRLAAVPSRVRQWASTRRRPARVARDRRGALMCADYRRKVAAAAYKHGLIQAKLDLILPPAHRMPNLEPQEDVRPTDPAPIFRSVDGGVEMTIARWWLIPWFHKGTMKEFTKRFATFNAKGEELARKRSFKDAFARRRCLIPADGWYEFTGPKGNKTKWLFTVRGDEWFCFAGLWDRAETADGVIESFTMVTQAAGTAMQPYHQRAPVVLRREEWPTWLDLTADVGPILNRQSEDRFDVEQVR